MGSVQEIHICNLEFLSSILYLDSVYQVRTAIKGWKPKAFGLEAERKYIEMNKAFAKCDRSELAMHVTDGMMAKLSPEMKSMQKLGDCVWESHGSVSRPKVVHLATAKVSMDTGEQRLTQITVRVEVKQSMAIYRDGKLIGGNPDDRKDVVEYIVLEKWLDGRWADIDWKIAGKVNPSPSQS
eukprot:jgi/Hompol1/2578/HPOL_006083-RA